MKYGPLFACRLPLAALALILTTTGLQAKSPDGRKDKQSLSDGRFIVVLEEAPLVEFIHANPHLKDAAALQSAGNSSKLRSAPGSWKLDARSQVSQDYLGQLDARFGELQAELAVEFGREVRPVHRYRVALNGFSAQLSTSEVQKLRQMPGVVAVYKDPVYKLHTDAGPNWIGAPSIWNGDGFIPESRGEGVVVGIIDSGINWDHNGFGDPGEGEPGGSGSGNHNHENPFGGELGLCSDPDVGCNDKLVGVWDFVEDDPDTSVVEENNNGRDNTNHGSLVAYIAAGNPGGINIGGAPLALSGVAPNANIVSYRVCYEGDPDDFEDDACQGSAILAAIDQAVTDGVDVVNYSIGSGAFSPWFNGSTARAFLNVYNAGIFAATSAGNSGPSDFTIGSPANAPWIMAIGSATHDRLLGSIVKATNGGDTAPPGDLFGSSLVSEGISLTDIVHAKDFGNALCGTGPEAGSVPSCEETSSASNPFPPGTFNGEIVVCDRGQYGRIEKGLNLMLAGAGGYILANTDDQGESIEADGHCLPSSHIGDKDGDRLRDWLDSGSGHQASITGFLIVNEDSVADRLSDFSSRGPNLAPVEDILKPDMIAPGDLIIAASNTASQFSAAGGTSFSSPHVTGGAALLKSNNSDWSPAMILSALMTTSTPELAKDENGGPSNPHEYGAGRPQLGEASLAGLYLDETRANFLAANPSSGGDPKTLNLPTMTNANCLGSCTFTRTVEPIVNNRTWTASTEGFPDGTVVTVEPSSFNLGSGGSQEITVTVEVGPESLGQWVFGDVVLTASNIPPARLPVTVFGAAGELPDEWNISSGASNDHTTFTLNGLAGMPGAVYEAGGLVEADQTTETMVEDPTEGDPYDGGDGVATILLDVPAGALWLHASTLESDHVDLDLFVGRDSNGNGQADPGEEACASTTPDNLELCDIFNPRAGTWWVLTQTWEDTGDLENCHTDPAIECVEAEVTTVTAVVGGESSPNLTATGPGILNSGDALDVMVSWSNVSAPAGTTLLGAVGIGSTQDSPNNVGIIPVMFERTALDRADPLALMDGRTHSFAMANNRTHDEAWIDVPPGTTSLDVTVSGADASQNNGLSIELFRVPFADAFDNVPFGPAVDGLSAVASASGSGGNGPSISLSDPQPGRYVPAVRNASGGDAAVDIQVDVGSSGDPIALHNGLWFPLTRPTISQGYEYNTAGPTRAMLWYTYDNDGQPAWYLAGNAVPEGNIWVADILRFTNDGENQVSSVVGTLAITILAENDHVFSWNLLGVSGSDRTQPLSDNTCPDIGGEQSYSGIWFRGADGLGGATVLVNSAAQAQIHYLYDDSGNPVWLIAADSANQSPTAETIPMLQFEGFCPTCSGSVSSEAVGTVTRTFDAEDSGSWTLDYMFMPPISSDVMRTDSIIKITDRIECK